MAGIREELMVEEKHMRTPRNATGLLENLLISGLETKLPNVCKPMAMEPTHAVEDSCVSNVSLKCINQWSLEVYPYSGETSVASNLSKIFS